MSKKTYAVLKSFGQLRAGQKVELDSRQAQYLLGTHVAEEGTPKQPGKRRAKSNPKKELSDA
ncbi:MAG: hypothetical protein RQ757_06965 [Pseudomonadales bacterium]|nr:hypothetical protein [Pseudomonadales bacterium]